MHRVLLSLCLLLAACGAPDSSLRATTLPNPTNIPATPGPSPTPAPISAYPYPAPQSFATPNPHLSARWDSATSATVQWSQVGRACLSRQPSDGPGVFVGCYEKVGTIVLTFGHQGPQDAAYAPKAGDTYVLVIGGETWRTSLRGRAQYLPSWRG